MGQRMCQNWSLMSVAEAALGGDRSLSAEVPLGGASEGVPKWVCRHPKHPSLRAVVEGVLIAAPSTEERIRSGWAIRVGS
jgi:hypothetical protein